MGAEEKCPVCERASEFVYRLDESEEKLEKSKDRFDEKLEKLEGEVDTKVTDIYKRINTVDARINALLVSCILLLLTVVVSKIF